MENKIKNLEIRMHRVEKKLKLTKIEIGKEVKCANCGYVTHTKSKLDLISCSNCGKKTKNTSIKKKDKIKFNAFEGKRYEDYDQLDMKKFHFGKAKFSKCCSCKKKVNFNDSYYGYNNLRCKKCYAKFCEQADREVSRVFGKV